MQLAQSKCARTFHKKSFCASFACRKNPSVWTRCLGEKGEGSLNVTSLCAIRTLTWNIFGYPPMSSKLKHGGGRLWQGKARKMRRSAVFGKILATTRAKRAKKQFASYNSKRYAVLPFHLITPAPSRLSPPNPNTCFLLLTCLAQRHFFTLRLQIKQSTSLNADSLAHSLMSLLCSSLSLCHISSLPDSSHFLARPSQHHR